MRQRAAAAVGAAARGLRGLATASRPGVTAAVMNRTTVALYLSGAGVVLVGYLLRPGLTHGELAPAFIGGCVLAAAGVHALRRRMRVWHYHLTHLSGVIVITVGVSSAGPDGWADAWIFALVAVEAVFFFPAAVAAAHVALIVAGLSLALGSSGSLEPGGVAMVASVVVALAVAVRALARAAEVSGIDPLTLLPDRTTTTERLERALEAAQRGGPPLVLALFGVDHLQSTNQRAGHAAGDALLRATAVAWRGLLPRGAVLGRWGGDQYALLVRAEAGAARQLVAQLHAAVPEGHSASSGVVIAEVGDEVRDLVDRAEGALAAAKRHQRGSSHLWTPGLPTVRGLYAALEDGSVEVHYQPVVRLLDGRTTGAEALVRWRRGDSYVPPGDFLPQAEASGAVVQLGRHVLQRACIDAASWPVPADGVPLTVAVNASGPELEEPDYAAWVVAALHRAGLPSRRLVVEVLEGQLDEHSPAVVDNLHALRAAGVRIAVDDFGTGWSGLARLSSLPLDVLKVDRSFVTAVEEGHEAPLCAGVIALAHALDLTIVAEGVETPHQASWLGEHGCEEGQGWLWAPALPTGAFAKRLLSEASRLGAGA